LCLLDFGEGHSGSALPFIGTYLTRPTP
jgi:hypothetical protein